MLGEGGGSKGEGFGEAGKGAREQSRGVGEEGTTETKGDFIKAAQTGEDTNVRPLSKSFMASRTEPEKYSKRERD